MRRVTIRQANDGWWLTEEEGPSGPPMPFKTAAEAEKFVRKVDRLALLVQGKPQVTVITWHPANRVGRMVVNAIAGRED